MLAAGHRVAAVGGAGVPVVTACGWISRRRLVRYLPGAPCGLPPAREVVDQMDLVAADTRPGQIVRGRERDEPEADRRRHRSLHVTAARELEQRRGRGPESDDEETAPAGAGAHHGA